MAALTFDDTPQPGDKETKTTGVTYVYDGVKWSQFGTSVGGGGSINNGENPPGNPNPGDLWFNTVNGQLYVYYDDGDSLQWVSVSGGGGGGGTSDLEDAPSDGKVYGRQDGAWVETPDVPSYDDLP